MVLSIDLRSGIKYIFLLFGILKELMIYMNQKLGNIFFRMHLNAKAFKGLFTLT